MRLIVQPRSASGFRFSVSVQAFTEDYGRFGGTIQQRIELGGTRNGAGDDDVPLVGAVRANPPAGVSRRSLVSALGLRKGEPAGKDALFEAEIDAEAFLRGRGWPDAQVSLRTVPSRKSTSSPGRATQRLM